MKNFSSNGKKSDIEIELTKYETHYQINCDDILSFWKNQSTSMPILTSLAFDLLCVPISNGTIERIFSVAGYCCDGRSNRLSGQNLERKVCLMKNKSELNYMD